MICDSYYLLNHKLPQSIYLNDPFFLAKKILLGSYLCSQTNGILTAGKITELEVYLGGHDKASHTYQYKKTPRTAIQWKKGGHAYIFFVYGMHHQFCVTTSPENEPNSILIRSLEPVFGIEEMCQRRHISNIKNLTTGPAKLCQALNITTLQNGIDLTGNKIWITPHITRESENSIMEAPRIGVNYADEYALKKWRFYLKDSLFISKKEKSVSKIK